MIVPKGVVMIQRNGDGEKDKTIAISMNSGIGVRVIQMGTQ